MTADPPLTTDPDVQDIAAALRVSIGLLVRRLRQAQPDGGVTLPETSALARLDRGGPATPSELARLERISPQSMGATIAALEARGLVERRPDPGDGRRAVISLTEAGSTDAQEPAERTDRETRCRPVGWFLALGAGPAEGRRAPDRATGAELLMTAAPGPGTGSDRYKWVALSNTTAAVFMSALDGSIVIIALPAIFRGINLDPLAPGNVVYLLWMIMGYRLVQAVLVVTVGRLGDMFGRVRIYNAGFAVFTAASILLSFDPYQGAHGALWLIGWRCCRPSADRC